MATSLEKFLERRRVAELEEFCLFWDGKAPPPEGRDALVQRLVARMSDEDTVHERWKRLAPRHREVVASLARCEGFKADRSVPLAGRAGVSPGEHGRHDPPNAPLRQLPGLVHQPCRFALRQRSEERLNELLVARAA